MTTGSRWSTCHLLLRVLQSCSPHTTPHSPPPHPPPTHTHLAGLGDLHVHRRHHLLERALHLGRALDGKRVQELGGDGCERLLRPGQVPVDGAAVDEARELWEHEGGRVCWLLGRRACQAGVRAAAAAPTRWELQPRLAQALTCCAQRANFLPTGEKHSTLQRNGRTTRQRTQQHEQRRGRIID